MNPSDLYERFILWIGDGTGASDTVLHIHAGMAVLLVARLVSGRSLATPWPLLAVYLAEFANEAMDYVAHKRIMPDTLADIVNTVFWPTVLFIGLRIRRARLDYPAGAQPEA
ncbi:MAG: hypothetical protein EOP58_02525 [Sphingomonadales bacterium]|nr:MAG: hypothetical protein EOP58_02525 [Sphingomonadales bacterium]